MQLNAKLRIGYLRGIRSLTPVILCLLLQWSATAQKNYQEAISLGDRALNDQQFEKAINYYFAAQAFDPAKETTVKQKVATAFRKIEALKNEAIQAKAQAEKNLNLANEAKAEAQTNLAKASKLVNAFYFYADRFALAYGYDWIEKKNNFYFIDKNGDEVKKLRRWEKAQQFDKRGYAKVEGIQVRDTIVNFYHGTREEIVTIERYPGQFILDTLGNYYGVSYAINTLTSEVGALDLRNQDLDSFPSAIFKFPKLEIIMFKEERKHGKGVIVQKDINKMQMLHYLSLPSVKKLPKTISKLQNLTYLELNNSSLDELPSEIGSLHNLKVFKFSSSVALDTVITIDPDTFEERIRIRKTRGITKLPKSIGQLSNLSHLNLSRNGLVDIPSEIGKLKSLTALVLEENQLSKLPSEIGKLQSLKSLSLNRNWLNQLPSDFGQLQNLTTLGLSSNQLSAIPAEMGQLQNLTTLDLSDNQLSAIPAEMGQLQNLTTLDLSDNQLSAIPAEMGQLQNLTDLYLWNNQLSETEKEKIKALLPKCRIRF